MPGSELKLGGEQRGDPPPKKEMHTATIPRWGARPLPGTAALGARPFISMGNWDGRGPGRPPPRRPMESRAALPVHTIGEI